MNAIVDHLKQQIPSFDLYKLHEVRSIHLEFTPHNGRQLVDLTIRTRYVDNGKSYRIKILLSDVRQLRLPEIGTNWFELSEVEIQPIDGRMMEDLKFHFEDYGGSGLSCDCKTVEFSVVNEGDWREQLETLKRRAHKFDMKRVVLAKDENTLVYITRKGAGKGHRVRFPDGEARWVAETALAPIDDDANLSTLG